MSDQLNKKLARRKALHLMFENTVSKARVCLENSGTTQTVYFYKNILVGISWKFE